MKYIVDESFLRGMSDCIRKYGHHKSSCGLSDFWGYDDYCSCGYSKMCKSLKQLEPLTVTEYVET